METNGLISEVLEVRADHTTKETENVAAGNRSWRHHHDQMEGEVLVANPDYDHENPRFGNASARFS